MFAEVTVDGEHVQLMDEAGTVLVQFDDELPTAPWRCTGCEERFTDEDEAEDEECAEAECVVHTGDDNCDDHECSFPHDLVNDPQPLTWLNSAAIHLDEEQDQVQLSISLGDPRGAFVMSLRRDKEDGRIYMEVPHPENWFLHLPLKPLSRGFYAVNEGASE